MLFGIFGSLPLQPTCFANASLIKCSVPFDYYQHAHTYGRGNVMRHFQAAARRAWQSRRNMNACMVVRTHTAYIALLR